MSDFLNRRDFIGGLAAFGLGGCRSAGFGGGEARLRVGVLSDTHLKEPVPTCASAISTMYWGDGFRNGWPTSTETFRRALTYFRDRGADAVLISGDMVDLGLRPQFETLKRTWDEVFPGDRAPDGRHVEKIWVTGNHEWGGWKYNCVKRLWPEEEVRRGMSFVSDPAGFWKEYVGEEYRPIFVKEVKGYKFLCAHFVSRAGVPDLPGFVDGIADSLRGTKPFFYVQHVHPKGTCSAPFAAADDGTATRVLSQFPNAIAFTGHSHKSLTDERTIWQGAFTSVGASSLRFVQNSPGCDNGNETPVEGSDTDQLLPPMDAYEGRQGMFMTVYDDSIRLERREFLYGESVGDDWIIPLGTSERPYAPAFRARHEEPPAFPRGAALRVVRESGKDRAGKDRQFATVVFPPARPPFGEARTIDYEVRALDGERVVATKCVFSPGQILPAHRDTGDVICRFDATKLPDAVRFEVRPRGAFGAVGAALACGVHVQ